MVEITYQMVLSTIQTAGILVGIAYYVMNLNYTRKNQEETFKTRTATFFHNVIGHVLSNSEALKYFSIVENTPFSSIEEYHELRKNPNFYRATQYVRNFFELAGIYLKNGLIDIEMVAQLHPYLFLWFWEMNRDEIYDFRNRRNVKNFYQNTEYAYNALKKYFEEHPELAP